MIITLIVEMADVLKGFHKYPHKLSGIQWQFILWFQKYVQMKYILPMLIQIFEKLFFLALQSSAVFRER